MEFNQNLQGDSCESNETPSVKVLLKSTPLPNERQAELPNLPQSTLANENWKLSMDQ
jgi:hypothetical protein